MRVRSLSWRKNGISWVKIDLHYDRYFRLVRARYVPLIMLAFSIIFPLHKLAFVSCEIVVNLLEYRYIFMEAFHCVTT